MGGRRLPLATLLALPRDGGDWPTIGHDCEPCPCILTVTTTFLSAPYYCMEPKYWQGHLLSSARTRGAVV